MQFLFEVNRDNRRRINDCGICIRFVFVKLINFHFSTLKLNIAKKVWGKEGIIEKDIRELRITEDDDSTQEPKTFAENYQSQDSTALVNISKEGSVFFKDQTKKL